MGFGIGCDCHCTPRYNILSLTADGVRRYTRYTKSSVCYYVHPHGNDLYSGSDFYSQAPEFGAVTGALQKWTGIGDSPVREWFSDFAGSAIDSGSFQEQIVGVETLPTLQDDHLIVVGADGYVYAMGTAGSFTYRVVRYTPTGIPDKALRFPSAEFWRGGVHLAGSGIQASSAGVGGTLFDADLSLNVIDSYGNTDGPMFFNVVTPVKVPGGWVDLSSFVSRAITESLALANVNVTYTGLAGAVTPDGNYLYVASLSNSYRAMSFRLLKLALPGLNGAAYPHAGPDGVEWQVPHGMSGFWLSTSNLVGLACANDGSAWMYDRDSLRHFDATGAITCTLSLTPLAFGGGVKGVRAIGTSDALAFGNFTDGSSTYNLVRATPGNSTPVWTAAYGHGDESNVQLCRDAHVSDAGDIYACGATIDP